MKRFESGNVVFMQRVCPERQVYVEQNKTDTLLDVCRTSRV